MSEHMPKTYLLEASTVRRHAPRTAGTYRLGTLRGGRFVHHCFGRSDDNVQRRLLVHAAGAPDTHFQVWPARTAYDAFRLECGLWHLDLPFARNRIHPGAPGGVPFVCPYCLLGRDRMTRALARALAVDRSRQWRIPPEANLCPISSHS